MAWRCWAWAAALLLGAPGPAWPLLATVLAGYPMWSVMEYALHRFVLHGMQPFRGMHELHHMRPGARIGTPTVPGAHATSAGIRATTSASTALAATA